MMKLPRLSGRELVKILSKQGFVALRQKGSHVILQKAMANGKKTTVVPLHEEIDKGTLHEIIRQSGFTKEEFLNIINNK